MVAPLHPRIAAVHAQSGKTHPDGVQTRFIDFNMSLTQSPASFTVGTPGTFTASIASDISTLELLPPSATVTLPSGFTNISAASNPVGGWSFVISGQMVTASYTGPLPIPPGITLPAIVVTATPDVTAVNLSTVTATVTAVNDSNPANNTATIQAVITQPTPTPTPVNTPDLRISVSADAANYTVGQTVTYTLTIQNGVSSAPILLGMPITISDLEALGLSNVAATASTGWNFTNSSTTSPSLITGTYTGAYPIIAGGTLPIITVTGTANGNVLGTVTNTATVSVPGDGNPDNNSATTTVTIASAPTPTPAFTPTPAPQDVNITSNVQGGPAFQVGQTLHFNLIVLNISSTTTLDATSGVAVYGLVPLGLTSMVATGNGWSLNLTNTTSPTSLSAIYTGPPVAPGGVFEPILVSGVLTNNAVSVFTDTFAVSDHTNLNTDLTTFSVNVSPSTQTVTATTTPTTTTTPTVPTGLGVSFNVHGGPTYQVGQTLTFDLIVTNNTTTTIDATSGAGFGDLVPLGLDNIVTTGSDWNVTATAPNGPFVIRAIYAGPPVAPGADLAPFEISGTLTSNASPSFMNTAGVADTLNPVANIASFNVSVAFLTPTVPLSPTVTVVSSPTVTVVSSPTVTVVSSPTVTVQPSPTVTVVSSPTVTVQPSPTVLPPQLSIVSSNPSGNTYAVGQTANYTLVVTSLPASLAKNQPIIVQDVFPVGLTNISATGNNWSIGLSSTTSPTLMTAAYTGLYPIAPGTVLPPIFISGILTVVADSSFTSAATVSSADDPNPDPALTTAIQKITILGSIASPTTIPALTTVPGNTSPISIVQSHLGGDHFKVGDTITYVLTVSNTPADEAMAFSIRVTDVLPLGLSHLKVVSPGWQISLSDSSSPAVMTATYTEIVPIPSGLVLPQILITGVLSEDAVPSVTNTAMVDTLGNINPSSNAIADTVFVSDTANNNNNSQNNNDNNSQNNNDNNHHQNQNNNNNNNNNNNSQNNHQNSSHNSSFPGLPATGSDPLGA